MIKNCLASNFSQIAERFEIVMSRRFIFFQVNIACVMDEQNNEFNEENYGAKGMDDDNPVLTLADILQEQDEIEEVLFMDLLFKFDIGILTICRHSIDSLVYFFFSCTKRTPPLYWVDRTKIFAHIQR